MVSISEERRRLAAIGLVLRRREQWGARFDSYGSSRPVDNPATRLFLHVTVTNPGNYSSNDAHARAVESIGISRFPNTGISYSGLLLPGALLYEGQPWGRRGAHTVNDYRRATCPMSGCPGRGSALTAPSWNLNVNARALGLARNVGDPVTDTDVRAAARWGAGHKLAGLAARDARWHGHRCVTAKSCPGDKGWARLDDIADLTADYLRRGHVAVDTSPTPPTGGTPVSATGPEKWDAADWAAHDQHVLDVTWGRIYPPMRGADKPPSMMTAIDQGYLASQRRTAARLAALEALLAKVAANEANDLTAEHVRQIVEDAVVKVEVTIRDETEPEPS